MRLLIVTQRVDARHPVLGFFHRWIEEFVRQTDKTSVIAQATGEHSLHENVQVVSLGKERGVSLVFQIIAFWRNIIALRKEYDAVLVHMTPIWIVLGAPVFLLLRKRMYLWYEARGTRWPLRLSLLLVRHVFSASPYGMPLATKKSIVTGHGIDTDLFSPDDSVRDETSVITVGRITASKRLPLILDAFSSLPEECSLTIIGSPITKEDQALVETLRDMQVKKGIAKRVQTRSLPQQEVISALRQAGLFLHASETALDKAVLEAMACGCLVVSTSKAMRDVLPEECRANDENFSSIASALLTLPPERKTTLRQELRKRITDRHSLSTLIASLVSRMS